MRFRFAHKLSTYLMVMCAYLAVASSGQLPDITVLLGFLGVVVSWFWEPPRVNFDKLTLPWAIVSLLFFAYSLLMTIGGGDFLFTSIEFLIYLLFVKLCNRRACKDYLHVYLLSFLLLVAGTVLNAELSYGVFFLGYVVVATWALILFHLRREMEDNYLLKHAEDLSYKRVQVERIMNSRRIVGRRFFIGTSLVSLTIFFVASMLFLAIPRIGFGLFFQKNRGNNTMTGFADGVTLGGHGVLKGDPTVVMRVYVESEYEGRRAPYIHWRGVAFDQYEKGVWSRSRAAPKARRQLIYPDQRTSQHHLLYAEPAGSFHELGQRIEGAMRQEIYLDPIGFDVLFGASMPLAFELQERFGASKARVHQNDELRLAHDGGVRYVVYSRIDPPPASALRAAPDIVPQGYEVYVQLAPEITDEVKKLAQEITRDARTNYDKAEAVRAWLQTNLSYSRVMESPGSTEPIHFFLFDRKQGHCEYFASAMAILLRAVGVPTRNVNGFLGGEWNEYEDYIAVRAGDAHSWVEVYFHGLGWVTFDPTPPGEADILGRGGTGIRARLRRMLDTMRFQWFKWVIDYDLTRQLSIFRGIRESLSGGATSVKEALARAKAWLARHREPAIAVGMVLLFGLIALTWWRARVQRYRGGDGSRRRDADPVSAVYRQVLARLAKRGHAKDPSATPREFALEMSAREVPGARALMTLTELHYQVAYGAVSASDVLADARAAGQAVEQAFVEARRAARRQRT